MCPRSCRANVVIACPMCVGRMLRCTRRQSHLSYCVCCRLSDALQFWQDMEIDIPKFWRYVAETVSAVVEDGTVPLSALTDVCLPLFEFGKAAVFFGEILLVIVRRQVSGLPTLLG